MELPKDETFHEVELDDIKASKAKKQSTTADGMKNVDSKLKAIPENPEKFDASNKKHDWKKGGNHFETCLVCKHNTGLRSTVRCRRCFHHVHADPCQHTIT